MFTNGLAYLRAVRLAVFVAATSLVLSIGALPARAVASIKIAIAYDIGGRGDHGINDSAAIGVDYIKKKYGLTALNVREMVTNGTESDRESRLQFLANANYNLIVAIGAQYAQAVSITALAFPSTQFALIDDSSVGNLNVSDMDFSNPQGAYLAGVLAGSATKTNKIGIVAPTAWAPNIPDFKKGVATVNKKAGVFAEVIGSAPIPPTKTLVGLDCDVIFSEWSATSEVEDTIAKLYTTKHPLALIGVSPDQYFLLGNSSQKILIGAVSKHVNTAVADVMTASLTNQSIVDVIDEAKGIFGHIYTVKDGGESMALTALGAKYSVNVENAVLQLKSGKVKLP